MCLSRPLDIRIGEYRLLPADALHVGFCDGLPAGLCDRAGASRNRDGKEGGASRGA
jgi:hypothetical protein